MEGLNTTPIQTLQKPVTASGEDIVLRNFRYLGSYNWTDSASPTIIVPGSPPVWQTKSLPFSVSPDQGRVFVDQNGHRMPSAVLLPLIRAVDDYTEQSGDAELDWRTVDFITDRNNLRKLLSWIEKGASAKDFRIDFQLAGAGTVLFNRWEPRTSEISQGYSYGHNFEKMMSRDASGCEGSTGHHRIVLYDLDGMKIVMRFEVDACYPSDPPPTSSQPRTSHLPTDDDDALADTLSSLNLSSAPSTVTSGLRTIRGGKQVPQSSIIELKTRSERSAQSLDWTDIFPQLFLSQTPHQIIGVHQRGRFFQLLEKNLQSAEMKAIERTCQPGFKRLRRALADIRNVAITRGKNARLSLVCRNGVLQVMERTAAPSCLPDEILGRF